jgi:hypothetical protein
VAARRDDAVEDKGLSRAVALTVARASPVLSAFNLAIVS